METARPLRRDTGALPWTATATPGVQERLLAPPDAEDRARTALVRLAAGASWSPAAAGAAVLVLEGRWTTPRGTLEPAGYGRVSAGSDEQTSSPTGCTLFVKAYGAEDFTAPDGRPLPGLHVQSSQAPWLPGHGGLEVKPLASEEGHGAALVHWPAGERFLPHRHWGGEEILVLSGTFRDEHGVYPTGTWLRSPHLSAHHPFVEEETVIFVRTGHLAIEPR